ncbi:hypothetical protein Maes01_01236 [Microbulbifer aestuariivivens]|uniref:Outer membrane protein OmpA-like transmembrane domain-containing protein n=2 Tax=Microbulbifer aestuariivivens TaxID=1908308 RepID=A0ABP9WNS8_9GAMM
MSGSYGYVDSDLDDFLGVNMSSTKGAAITFGYRVNQYVAIESGYTDFGSTEGSDFAFWLGNENPGPAPDTTEVVVDAATRNVEASTSSFKLGVVLSTDIWQTMSAGFKVGVHSWESDLSAEVYESLADVVVDDVTGEILSWDTVWENSYSISETIDGTDAYYGVTGGWRFNNLLVSVDYTRYVMDEVEPTIASISVGYDF